MSLMYVVIGKSSFLRSQSGGVQSIAKVDFDDLNAEDIKALDEFIASFGCSPSQPHPCSKYADPIFA